MADQDEALRGLIAAAIKLDDQIGDYLDEWPSARVSNARLTYIINSLRNESVKLEQKAERSARVAANAADRSVRMEYTKFEIEMAETHKARGWPLDTPEKYRAAQQKAAGQMVEQSPEEVAKIMREAG